ncbi:MAG: polysaccharide pyruvyl transferase family protein [Lentisphaerales bacterium]|nr:MAG: polysaccharide pyruvyl transferase family protein [Lentisphaerales bacterium]
MQKIRILTYHYLDNNGSFLQAYAVLSLLKRLFPRDDVKISDCRLPGLGFHELLKIAKPRPGKPLFAYRRHRLFRECIRRELELDRNVKSFSSCTSQMAALDAEGIDLAVVGSDIIWSFGYRAFLPSFPNLYWLPGNTKFRKVAFAASSSGHVPRVAYAKRSEIASAVQSFDIVTVRDAGTARLLKNCGVEKEILVMPDPTLLWDFPEVEVKVKLKNLGVDLDRPTIAVLFPGKDRRVKEIIDYFRASHHQVIALSMYNPYADVNLGDELTPFEWAETLRHVGFCVTDRFHGAAFCLKHGTPFIVIEHKQRAEESKRFDLVVREFGLPQCYLDLTSADYEVSVFEDKYTHVAADWTPRIRSLITERIEHIRTESTTVLQRMHDLMINRSA